MIGDGGALDRDISEQVEELEQMDLLEGLKFDYKNKEFYSLGNKTNE